MPRILEPGQIETHAQQAAPRVRLPERAGPFAARARRLRRLGERGQPGQSIGDYLRLMAALVDAQALAFAALEAPLPSATDLARSHRHGMPPVQASGWRPPGEWRGLALRLCSAVAADPAAPPAVRDARRWLEGLGPEEAEAQADALLTARHATIERAAAPFLMAALQVYWVSVVSRLLPGDIPTLGVPGVCPACGTLPVASVVRSDARSQGYRFLHCGLCAAEWHLVRVTCSHCQSTAGIAYHSIEGGSEAIRAESCEECHTYRKILYQEKDAYVEPVADDLASLALDLLMSEAGFHRGSGNPLLWQQT
ncbi:MAG TPA: formate dehydrogenase accessory protein FdhE [Steroidobacteraceae bacterium]|nr:formate dehydrogenase accessory protein FdhE [Steroidobacteraceae bacterium]